MALKSTIYRMQLHLSDMNRGHYAQYGLTVARHPSETAERLMMRVVAFCAFADERLRFGAGLSNAEEPDLQISDLIGQTKLWVEVGLPEPRWIGKAMSKSEEVAIVAYGSGTSRWLKALDEHFATRETMHRLKVIHALPLDQKGFEGLAERNLTLSCTIQDSSMWLTGASDTVEVGLPLV